MLQRDGWLNSGNADLVSVPSRARSAAALSEGQARISRQVEANASSQYQHDSTGSVTGLSDETESMSAFSYEAFGNVLS